MITATILYNNEQEVGFGESDTSNKYAIEEAFSTMPDIFLEDTDNLTIRINHKGVVFNCHFASLYNMEREYF
jgi:hypothetical protein